ncbi:MAG: two-component sensor histidine kinase [Burkholderiales bacterium]|nr:two-component sensor histidine kinase [Burkholderiales bacterium]
MSIRKTLLFGFLLVGVTPAVLLALLGFSKASQAVQAEIERGLSAQAEALASDVDKRIYERLQNAVTWSRLEVMQDLQVGDVDKRLSSFLQRLQRGYAGLYLDLSASNAQGWVVASSDAAQIGQRPAEAAPWQRASVAGSQIALDLPRPRPPDGGIGLSIRVPVQSAFGAGTLGELRLTYDWAQIDGLLEQAASGGRLLALLDAQGRMVAGSQRLRQAVPRGASELADWVAAPASGSRVAPGRAPLPAEPMIVGVGRARAFAGFDGLGWRVLVLVPQSEALAPIRSMALGFAFILGVIALVTLLAADWVSRTIARPIVALTGFTRDFMHQRAAHARGVVGQRVLSPPPAARGDEVGELRDAFVQMVGDIDQSQQKLARASALAAVGEMSAAIAHEVRTPLGILRSSAQMLQREAGLSAEAKELLGFIESETQRLNGLVSSMLDSARPRAPVFAPTDVNELVRHGVAMLAAQAVKQNVRLATRLEARHAVVPWADDGPGIAPEARARVFEAFFFRREGGLGLGLAVVQRIVAAHGGDIEAGESQLGGALFRIRLPTHNAEST